MTLKIIETLGLHKLREKHPGEIEQAQNDATQATRRDNDLTQKLRAIAEAREFLESLAHQIQPSIRESKHGIDERAAEFSRIKQAVEASLSPPLERSVSLDWLDPQAWSSVADAVTRGDYNDTARCLWALGLISDYLGLQEKMLLQYRTMPGIPREFLSLANWIAKKRPDAAARAVTLS